MKGRVIVIRSAAVVVAVAAALRREGARGILALSELGHGLHPRDVDKLYDRSLVSSDTSNRPRQLKAWQIHEYAVGLTHRTRSSPRHIRSGVRNGEARVAVALVEALVHVSARVPIRVDRQTLVARALERPFMVRAPLLATWRQDIRSVRRDVRSAVPLESSWTTPHAVALVDVLAVRAASVDESVAGFA